MGVREALVDLLAKCEGGGILGQGQRRGIRRAIAEVDRIKEETLVVPSVAVDPRYIPTEEDLFKAWASRNYANVPEKIEYELGFEVFMSRVRAEAL